MNHKENIGIIIQARMGSTRLPRKILSDFYQGETLIEILINNLLKIQHNKLLVATSVNPNNDELVAFLETRNVIVYRGSEEDVLSRFIGAAETNGLDGIVRICSDNPFLDWHSVADLIEKARTSTADYIGYRINSIPSIKTHFGFWGEYVKLDTLKNVAKVTDDQQAHEHVTNYIYTHPEKYRCEWIDAPDYLQGRDDIRLTVDTAEDFENAKQVYTDLMECNSNFDLEDIVHYIDSNIDIQRSMKKLIENNKK